MRLTLARLIAGASTAGALIAGLNAGSAKAVLSCTFGDFAGCNGPDNGVTFSDWKFGQYTTSTGYDNDDTINITYDPITKSHTIFFDFTASGTSLKPGTTGSVQYSVSGRNFKEVTASFGITGDLRSFGFDSEFVSGFDDIIVNSGTQPGTLGPFGPTPFSAGINSITSFMGWNSSTNYDPADGNSVTHTLTYQDAAVPGPLPVLGAGAAFGFSRRLRRRIQKRA